MAYNYLDDKQLHEALHESEEYMKDFYDPIPELQRITRGRPGKIPAGKPRVTDGTLAGIRRENPKQIIQQLPTGKVTIRSYRELETVANGVLTDIIIPNANSGGTPFSKAKRAIKAVHDIGSAWAVVFYNRTGSTFHADYRLKHYRDILFEKGKVSEFDSNFFPVIDWLTETDLKALIWQQKELKRLSEERGEDYTGDYDLKMLQKLLSNGPAEKDDDYKTAAEKKSNASVGYFKLVTFYQRGAEATFMKYAPAIKSVVGKCVTKDPRGIMPVHGLVAEEDDENPLGEPLAAISAGKQNLADFKMQMHQYVEGLTISPPLKKWGQTPAHKIKLVPDHIIEMQGTRQTDDVEVMDIASRANNNYANDMSYLKTQMYNEQGGTNDTSVSGSTGAVGYSKTDAGVNQQESRMDASQNDLRKTYEAWQGRIWETALNIHFAESFGTKELELEDETMKRLKMTQAPSINYDQEFGAIKFVVDASTSKESDNNKQNEKLVALMEQKRQMVNPDDKDMRMYNQVVQNSGVPDPEKLMYTDDEVEYAAQFAEMTRQQTLQQMQMQSEQAQMAHEQAMNPQPALEEPTVGEPPLPEDALEPAPVDPAIEEDREIARQALLERGFSEEEAELELQAVDEEMIA